MGARSPSSYRVSADLFLRALSLIYLCAFVSLWIQLPGLYSSAGLLPIDRILSEVRDFQGSDLELWNLLRKNPSLIVLGTALGYDADAVMEVCVLGGALTSLVAATFGCGSALISLQYVLYLSVFKVGQTFLSFQWDILLLETGFAAIFLARPLVFARWTRSRPDSKGTDDGADPPLCSLHLVRFILFKIMLSSGIVKIQSDCPTWLKLTACNYHFATQCLPTPLAWYFNLFPPILMKISVAATIWIETAAPVLILLPFSGVQKLAAVPQIILQVFIILSGNYCFFNLLTIALCIPLLDDAALGETKAPSAPEEEEEEVRWSLMDRIDARGPLGLVYDLTRKTSVVAYLFCVAFTVITVREMFDWNKGDLALLVTRRSLQRTVDAYLPMGVALYGVGLIIAGLYDIMTALMESKRGLVSFALIVGHRVLVFVVVTCIFTAGLVPAIEPLSPKSAQKMWPVVRRAYESSAQFHITGAYGLFRRMTGVGDPEGEGKLVQRPELQIEGSYDGTEWVAYNWTYGKPGDPSQRPSWVAPHQPRLDWQMWFAALNPNYEVWFVNLVYKLLVGEPSVLALLGENRNAIFRDAPPNWVRVTKYHYNFTTPGVPGDGGAGGGFLWGGKWWHRTHVGVHVRALHREDESLITVLRENRLRLETSEDKMETAEEWVRKSHERSARKEDSLRVEKMVTRWWTTKRAHIAAACLALFWLPSLTSAVLARIRARKSAKTKVE